MDLPSRTEEELAVLVELTVIMEEEVVQVVGVGPVAMEVTLRCPDSQEVALEPVAVVVLPVQVLLLMAELVATDL
jgi:hypothetical protein